MHSRIAEHVHAFGAVQAGFDVKQKSIGPAFVGAAEIRIAIADAADRPVRPVGSGRGPLFEPFLQAVKPNEIDPNAQVDPDLSQRVAEIVELIFRIASGVAHDNHAATPPIIS